MAQIVLGLALRRITNAHVHPRLVGQVPTLQPDVRRQTPVGAHLLRYALGGSGGISSGRVQEDSRLSAGRGIANAHCLGTPAGKNPADAGSGLRDARLPGNRLANSGLARKDKRPRARPDAVEERPDRRQLLIPAKWPHSPSSHYAPAKADA
jgi:hypothetical protein